MLQTNEIDSQDYEEGVTTEEGFFENDCFDFQGIGDYTDDIPPLTSFTLIILCHQIARMPLLAVSISSSRVQFPNFIIKHNFLRDV